MISKNIVSHQILFLSYLDAFAYDDDERSENCNTKLMTTEPGARNL